MERQYHEDEIDLLELFFALVSKWKYIAFSAISLGVITALVNLFLLVPQYSSTSKMYILTKSTSLTSIADLQVGTSLTQDYLVIIKSRPVVEEVIENLKLDMTYEEMVGKISVTNPSDTRILHITVTDSDATEAKRIADEFARVSAAYISDKMDQDPPNIIEYGYANPNPIAPNKTKNTLLGIMIGVVASSAVIIFFYLLDDSIKTEDDIERYLGMNTLAVVPEIEGKQQTKKKKRKPVRKMKKGKKDGKGNNR